MSEAKIYEVAKARFRANYEKSYPLPIQGSADKPTMQGYWRNHLVQVCFAILFAASFMSALRTYHVLATVGVAVEGAAGVVVIEGVAGFISFFLVLQKYKEDGKVHSTITGWMQMLVLASILLALLTNLYSMMLYQDATLGIIEWALFILAGSIAVFAIAVLSHILGTLYVQNLADFEGAMTYYRDEIREIKAVYEAELKAWSDEFERQWAKPTNQRRWLGMVQSYYDEQTEAVGRSVSSNATYQQSSAMASLGTGTEREHQPPMGFAGFKVNSSVPTERNGNGTERDRELARKVLEQYPHIPIDEKGWHVRITEATDLQRGRATTRVYEEMKRIKNEQAS